MLYWLLNEFGPLLRRMELHSSGDSRVFLTARIALASITSFLLALLLGPFAISWLKRRFRERIASASERLNEIQASKQSTPTMGGLFIVSAIVIATLLCGDLGNHFVQLALFVVVGFASLGAADDWIKLSTRKNGLTVRQKLAWQLALSAILAVGLYHIHSQEQTSPGVIWPIGNVLLPLGLLYIAWSMLVSVGASNAVNLTDGLDGLAGGCLIFAGLTFVGLTYVTGHKVLAEYVSTPFVPGCGELAVVLGAMVGSMLGFLWFNCYPAQVFMGDTGSLPLGALLGLGALASRQEVLLVVCGGIFVVEALSVILQVGWFRLTKKRLIACSPLHNHYLFKGQHEMKIVVRFWIGSALLSIMAVASLKIR
jgi:phospho-N-acetylmuramoyl-pentapeptide-transferase